MSPCHAFALGSGLVRPCRFFRPLFCASRRCQRRISPTPRMEAAEEAGAVSAEEREAGAFTQQRAVAGSTEVGLPAASTVGREAPASMAAVWEAFMGEAMEASTPADLAGSTLADFLAAAFVPVHRRAREWINLSAAHEEARATRWCFAAASTPATGSVAGTTGAMAGSGATTPIFGRATARMTISTRMGSRTPLSPGITAQILLAITPM